MPNKINNKEWDQRARNAKDPSIIYSIKDLVNHLNNLNKSNGTLQKRIETLSIIQVIIAIISILKFNF